MVRILSCGVPLTIRARVQGALQDVKLEAVPASQLFPTLERDRYDAVLIDEGVAPGDTLERLARQYSGPIVLCARNHHEAASLRQMLRSLHVARIFQHPLDPREVALGLAATLGLQLRKEETLSEPSPLWSEQRRMLVERLESWLSLLDQELDGSAIETMWRFLHQLSGSLGHFGLDEGALVARQASHLAQGALKGQPLDQSRMARLLRVLRQLVKDQLLGRGQSWIEGSLLAVTRDDALYQELVLEALMLHRQVVRSEDVSSGLSEPRLEGIVVDCAGDNPPPLLELCDGSLPVVLIDAPPDCQADTSLVTLHRRPVDAYRVVLAALKRPQSNGTPVTVLVADDDPITLKVVATTLSGLDMRVECLDNALEFWDRVVEIRPDLILLDVDLPPLGGIELCKNLRSDPRFATTLVLFLSSFNDAETVQRAYAAGADDYLFKPATALELITRVRNRLQRARALAGCS